MFAPFIFGKGQGLAELTWGAPRERAAPISASHWSGDAGLSLRLQWTHPAQRCSGGLQTLGGETSNTLKESNTIQTSCSLLPPDPLGSCPLQSGHSCLTLFPAPSLHAELRTLELLGLPGWGLPVLEAVAAHPGSEPRGRGAQADAGWTAAHGAQPCLEQQQLHCAPQQLLACAAGAAGSSAALRAQYTSCAKWCVSSSSAEGL